MEFKTRKTRRRRKGGAIVELAVCLPIITLIVFGAIEAAGMIFLKQALVQTAYEAAKVASSPQGNETTARAAAARVLEGRQLENVTITFDPGAPESIERGNEVRVIVNAPANTNSLIDFGFYQGTEVSVEAVMQKE